MPAPSATRTALVNELKAAMSNWNINLSSSQFNALIAHIEGIILSNSATVIADVTADLAIWQEPIHSRHT